MSNTTDALDLDAIELAAKRAQTMNVPLTVTAEQALALVAEMRTERSRVEAYAHSWNVADQDQAAAEAKLAKIRAALNDVAQRHDLTILTIYRILNEESQS